MFNLSKSNVAFVALLMGLPVALLFQNCGQAGSILKTGGEPHLEQLEVIWRQAPKTSGEGHYSHRNQEWLAVSGASTRELCVA